MHPIWSKLTIISVLCRLSYNRSFSYFSQNISNIFSVRKRHTCIAYKLLFGISNKDTTACSFEINWILEKTSNKSNKSVDQQ
jgi:hypothetical protein